MTSGPFTWAHLYPGKGRRTWTHGAGYQREWKRLQGHVNFDLLLLKTKRGVRGVARKIRAGGSFRRSAENEGLLSSTGTSRIPIIIVIFYTYQGTFVLAVPILSRAKKNRRDCLVICCRFYIASPAQAPRIIISPSLTLGTSDCFALAAMS